LFPHLAFCGAREKEAPWKIRFSLGLPEKRIIVARSMHDANNFNPFPDGLVK